MSKLQADLTTAIWEESDAVSSIVRSITAEFERGDFGQGARGRIWNQVHLYVAEAFLRRTPAKFPQAPVDGMKIVSSLAGRDTHGESDDLKMGNTAVPRWGGPPANVPQAPVFEPKVSIPVDPELERLLKEEKEIEVKRQAQNWQVEGVNEEE